ncbi:MAG: DNA internalization-related competence protein ComEC/Rec2 [Myxococcales bacterium]|nr:DNA internalization-related competence protein ComEC/Rec2 [Myxococcales bacterium]
MNYRGRWWGWAALVAWSVSVVWSSTERNTPWVFAVGMAMLAAWRLARLGATVMGPVLAASALCLVASAAVPGTSSFFDPVRSEAAGASVAPIGIPIADLPLPRTQRPIQRIGLTGEVTTRRYGCQIKGRWLSSCVVNGRCRPRSGWLRLTLPPGACHLGSGTVIRAAAFVHPPPGYLNPGADGARHRWRRLGLRGRVRVTTMADMAVEGRRPSHSTHAALRERLRRGMAHLVPGRAGGLLRALALGDRSGVDAGHRKALRQTGTAHVLAVSGTHVGFVLALVLAVLRILLRLGALDAVIRRFPLPMCDLWFGGGVIIAYAALTGAAPSTLRAVCVTLVALAVRASGTRPAPLELLGLVALAALVVSPTASFDAGLTLSLLGALGAILGARMPIAGGPVQRAFVVSCAATASTSLVSVPLFGQVPLLAPLANLLVVPYVGLVVLPLALLTLVAAALSLGAAGPVLRISAELAVTPLDAMTSFGHWPCVQVGGLDGWIVGIGLAVSLAVAVLSDRHRAVRITAILSIIVTAVTLRPVIGRPSHGEVRVDFLDVGHGDATVLRFGDGTVMLVDGGGEVGDDGRVGRRAVLPALRAMGVRKIHIMVLSHAHPDHENGLLAVARALPVQEFWFNGQGNRSREHAALIRALTSQATQWVARPARDIAGVHVRTLWPPPHGPIPHLGLNDNSLVLEVSTRGGRLLLAGDVEHAAEHLLVQRGLVAPVDLLKVPHHGSRTSSTAPFLDRTRPRLAIAGARSWGQLPFPDVEVAERYARRHIGLWTTDKGHVSALMGRQHIEAWQGAAKLTLRPRPVAANLPVGGSESEPTRRVR